jgi:hypothetical protein
MQISTSLLALAAVIAAATALPAEAGALPKSNKSFAPQRNAAARPKQVSQTDQFCQKFTAECYNQALHGKTGKVKVVHACRRNGKQFTFGCKAGQTTLTKHVLAKLDAASVSTVIVPTATTVTSTTETVSYTAQETTTSTIASLGDQPIPVVQYVITGNQALGRRAIDKRTTSKPPGRIDNSNFCTAYTAACKRQCARRSSTPRAEVCHLSSISGSRYKYDLSCFCKNGWVETQHALADLGNSVSIAKVSTVKTSTSTITTSSAVATTTATSTTNVILAPTGSIKAVNRDDGTDVGYVVSYKNSGPSCSCITDTLSLLLSPYKDIRHQQSQRVWKDQSNHDKFLDGSTRSNFGPVCSAAHGRQWLLLQRRSW